ncbi:MAG: UDP-N-acetyl-D-glucosamine 2-epimerase, UDP-hydrolysing [Bacteroidetes bacterium GWF2_33_38]|nr:MAG: UDP-N-acetyl-D-glucosamine 2-epimerase, UDP-hydrolysing [Bacteroidetes bacterium GWF2_33_38]OFY72788.1 MAG: UDP-N-acetyl-D-glucosamine 2-epimerase, UDP-hydrolysing [Bacteroidetes bacterium RIFOXYA12_FULL_33_9]OFY91565.1 MAG: UDP-N-acetyl-D-glucosamine 2-epimerase, UDP-hydrolysing [Bacteroidetes bacterium RIFOXYA2_FULL_33_7]
MKIGVLTSSRADFGVYLPLLKAFVKDSEISFEIIAFGTHLSNLHGYTINEIRESGFIVKFEISSMLADDSELAVSTSGALTSLKFSDFWDKYKDEFDLVLCLGDRFEMFSAVIAGIPFGIKFAHFYGGDYSQGAIDNVYRNGMTHSSILHFTSTTKCANRVRAMINSKENVYDVGILSLSGLNKVKFLSKNDFYTKWHIDLNIPTILITFHPETIDSHSNEIYSQVVYDVLLELKKTYQLVITMPNADTNGITYRRKYELFTKEDSKNVFLIENFGIESYMTCMKYSLLMIGNTSSGITESASFNKYFVNVGKRQKGREMGNNIINSDFEKSMLIQSINLALSLGEFNEDNIYFKKDAIDGVLSTIKFLLENKRI